MENLAKALIEAIVFIAARDYQENETPEDWEDQDVTTLEGIQTHFENATEEEQVALKKALDEQLIKPNLSERWVEELENLRLHWFAQNSGS